LMRFDDAPDSSKRGGRTPPEVPSLEERFYD
jgi:hypothetical protein